MTLENFGQLRLTKPSLILCSFTLEDNFQFPTKSLVLSKIDQVNQNSQSVHIANKMYIVHYGNTDCGVFKWGGTKLDRFLPVRINILKGNY